MNKYLILIILFFSSITISVPQAPELAAFDTIKDECPPCERIYELRNQMNNLNIKRLQQLANIANWLKTQPETFVKSEIQINLNRLQDLSNKLIAEIAYDDKVRDFLEQIKTTVDNIDRYLPLDYKLKNMDFYENMKILWGIYKDLKTESVPGDYNRWLAKRVRLVVG